MAETGAEHASRILFVFACLAAEADTRELRVLASGLDPARYAIEAVACFRAEGPSERTHDALAAAGVPVDRTPYHLSFEDTVEYLAGKLPAYDIVVGCQNVADLYPALERLHLRPALIERGASVAEALAGPKHFTARYAATTAAARDAAAGRIPGREEDAVLLPATGDPTLIPRWRALFDDVLHERPPRSGPTGLFRGFLQGGFECSTHRRASDRRRLDMIAASHHDRHAEHDYRALARHGILTVRDGLRWHLIERAPGRYDWSSLDAQRAAARATGTEVIWDLLHYGWPDDIDIWTPAFVARFAAFAAATARHIGPAAPGERRFYAPVNEISFFAWGGGDVGYLNPFTLGRGQELKTQLARAAIAAMEAILAVDPAARFVHPDPVINVIADAVRPAEAGAAEGHRRAQFAAWDMIAGRAWPQLGGRPALLDIVGVNFYHDNQWIHGGPPLAVDDPRAKPFHALLAETYARYGRPIFVAETGIEGAARPGWLRMIMSEVARAIALGVPVEGVCLYPALDHPGWDDERYCPNGLLAFAEDAEARVAYPPLAAEIARLSAGMPATQAPRQ